MILKLNRMVVAGILIWLCAACGGQAQGELPTIAPSPTAEAVATDAPVLATIDINQGVVGTATMDIAGVAATSDAISAPLQAALTGVTGVQNLLSVSASADANGIAVNVEAEIAQADDNEVTMVRISDVVTAQSTAVTRITVHTWIGAVLQRTWVWQNGVWSPG